MRRITKVGVAVAGLPLLLAACSSSSGGSSSGGGAAATSSAAAGSGGTLVVWADNSANTAKAVEPLCQAWAQANGVTCTVKKFNGGGDLQDALVKGNATGDVPDVFEGPHNGIGTLVKNGLIAPIDLSANKAKFAPAAIAGVTNGSNTYAVPWAVENVGLFTNKDLAPSCPATLDDAVTTAKAAISSGKATAGLGIAMQIGDKGDFYHWFPMYTADGGYAFKQNSDGTYDVKDLGVGKDGSVAAGKRLKTLVDQGILKPTVSFDIAKESFGSGKSPYMITGPWATPDLKAKLGDKLMVCPVPPWQGSSNKAIPFLGVRAFFQAAKAKNAALASTFLNDEVMTTAFMDGMYKVDPRPSAWMESFATESSDPIVKALGEYGKAGIPMPAVPQMDAVFAEGGLAQYKIATGADPASTMTTAADAINKTNAALG
jgi:arabinogalactan oligomer/maltooligosaccharide transport system substrate-binding protein